jgi:hypothetical protein
VAVVGTVVAAVVATAAVEEVVATVEASRISLADFSVDMAVAVVPLLDCLADTAAVVAAVGTAVAVIFSQDCRVDTAAAETAEGELVDTAAEEAVVGTSLAGGCADMAASIVQRARAGMGTALDVNVSQYRA